MGQEEEIREQERRWMEAIKNYRRRSKMLRYKVDWGEGYMYKVYYSLN